MNRIFPAGILLILLILSSFSASAANFIFDMGNFQTAPLTTRKCLITPNGLTTNLTHIVPADQKMFTTGTNAQFTVTNMVPQYYFCEVQAPPAVSGFWIQITNALTDTNTYYVAGRVVPTTDVPSGLTYTKAQIDAIIAAIEPGEGVGITYNFNTGQFSVTGTTNVALNPTNWTTADDLLTAFINAQTASITNKINANSNAIVAALAASTNVQHFTITNNLVLGEGNRTNTFRTNSAGGVSLWDQTGNEILKTDPGQSEFTSYYPFLVPEEAYDATGWNGSSEVPTKNAVRDKIESLGGGSGILGVTNQNILYVGKDGNDGSAVSNRLDKKFLTITAAKAVYQAGQTIHVFPGTYAESLGVLPADVYIYFENGAKLVASNAQSLVIISNGNATITGYGTFTNLYNSVGAEPDAFRLYNGHLHLEGISAIAPGTNAAAIRHLGGTSQVKLTERIYGGYNGYLWMSGNFHIDCPTMDSSPLRPGTGFWSDYRDYPISISGTGWISANVISGYYVYPTTGGDLPSDYESRIWVTCKEMTGDITAGFRTYITSQKIHRNIVVGAAEQLWLLGNPKILGTIEVQSGSLWCNASGYEGNIFINNVPTTSSVYLSGQKCTGTVTLLGSPGAVVQIDTIDTSATTSSPIVTAGNAVTAATIQFSHLVARKNYFSTAVVETPGADFAISDEVTLDGGDNNATLIITDVDGGDGHVLSAEVLTSGTGYSDGIYSAIGGGGTGLEFTIDVSDVPSISPDGGAQSIRLMGVHANTDKHGDISVISSEFSW